jgi:poly [ADP-ribose] polymerase 2/3/4
MGRTQPVKWQDAGTALDNDDLEGCHMPLGPAQDQSTGAYLQYNEVGSFSPLLFKR